MPSQGVGYHQERKIPDPAKKKIPDSAPIEALCTSLTEQRAQGVPFTEAWEVAVPIALALTTSRNDKAQWTAALIGTKAAWRKDYLQRGPRRMWGGPAMLDEVHAERPNVRILG